MKNRDDTDIIAEIDKRIKVRNKYLKDLINKDGSMNPDCINLVYAKAGNGDLHSIKTIFVLRDFGYNPFFINAF